ncbi:hypothetical protein JL720_8203 [Aureococcus anophagefferens]|nr:hypothetical protein JL720_8203 [Aureococcus anophagefferens]
MIKQADASTIAAKLLVMDRIPLITKVTERPDAEFVEIIRRAGGDAKAKAGVSSSSYLMIMAMFELHACARGAPARVVGVGAESRKLCDCFWSKLSSVDVIGMIMHPDKWHRGPSKIEAAEITAEELDKSGFETERLEHVALDDCATNIARACGVRDVRSQRMVEAWQPGGFMRVWWDGLTPQQKKQEQRDRANRLPHMRDDWVSKYATAEDYLEANRARTAERNAKSLARVANVVTAGFEPGKSPFPRVYDLEGDFTPEATKTRNKNRAKSSKSAGA